MFWAKNVGMQGLQNPGTILSFQPTAKILEYVIFLYSGMLPLCEIIVLGQKSWTLRVTKPLTYFEFLTNSSQILEFVIFLYSGIYPSHKTVFLGQKKLDLKGNQTLELF